MPKAILNNQVIAEAFLTSMVSSRNRLQRSFGSCDSSLLLDKYVENCAFLDSIYPSSTA